MPSISPPKLAVPNETRCWRITYRQRFQDQSVNQRKNRGVRPDAQGERKNGYRREPRRFGASAAKRSGHLAENRSYMLLHQLLQFFFGDNFAVEEMDFALGVLGKARVVRHHADGRAFAVQIAQKLHDGFAVAESRFPVGSSASRMEGLPPSARATATRCC